MRFRPSGLRPVLAAMPGRLLCAGLLGCAALATQDALAVSCSASTVGVAFGAYDVFSSSPVPGTGSVKVNCSLTTETLVKVNYTISLATGSSNSFVQRTMAGGGSSLHYNLYTSNSYSTVWGDGSGSTATVSGSMTLIVFFSPTGSATVTVYGQVPALQDVTVSNYQDNVTVTVSY
ncbi:MAG TPA: spore coat U domain-containing protein [Casimicrobiaceae bacterium]|nr:spore coat U domain-containing protein [Casimicrobiaceae bacterium]